VSSRKLVITLLVATLVIAPLAATVYYVTRDEETHTLTGSFVLINPDLINKLGRYCTGQRGYGDLRQGTRVTLWDAHSNIIATGATSTGIQGESECTFNFSLDDVPEVEEYHLQFTDRPVSVFGRSQLEQSNWVVRVDVGD